MPSLVVMSVLLCRSAARHSAVTLKQDRGAPAPIDSNMLGPAAVEVAWFQTAAKSSGCAGPSDLQ